MRDRLPDGRFTPIDRRSVVMAALRAAGRHGLHLSAFAEAQGWSLKAAWHALDKLRAEGAVRLVGAPRSHRARWVDASLSDAVPRRSRWPWDDRGRSAITRADVVEGIRQADVLAPVPWG